MTAAMRALSRPGKGVSRGIEARGQFDALMERIPPHRDVEIESGSVGGIPGFWVNPSNARAGEAIIHLHGGWFNFGSARSACNLAGHLSARVGAKAFVPDYRLAPEYPFPAAVNDLLTCYEGLAAAGVQRVVLTGDSAGGNLALGLAASVVEGAAESAGVRLVGVAVLSPITDLSLSGSTYETRADADPLFTRPQVSALVRSYLAGADASLPQASPLHGRFSGMPPVRIHVGDDEVLLADSLRYVERAVAAGVDARVDVWMGMPHGFAGSVGRLKAAEQTLRDIGAFLAEQLARGVGA